MANRTGFAFLLYFNMQLYVRVVVLIFWNIKWQLEFIGAHGKILKTDFRNLLITC